MIDRNRCSQHLQSKEKILIIGHDFLDGDALGSCLALGRVLQKMGKTVNYYSPTKPSKSFDFVENSSLFETEYSLLDTDLVVVCDTADPNSLLQNFWEDNKTDLSIIDTISIDHHISNTMYADCTYVDNEASSTCELLAEFFSKNEEFDAHVDGEVANHLLLGMITDTGRFLFEKNPTRCLQSVLYTLKKGAEKQYIVDKLFRSHNLDSIQFQSEVLTRIQRTGKILWTYWTGEDLTKYGLDKEKADSILGQLTSIEHDGIYLLAKCFLDKESGSYAKLSFRSPTQGPDVSKIASQFGGGGHKSAAGAKVTFKGENLLDEITNLIKKIKLN